MKNYISIVFLTIIILLLNSTFAKKTQEGNDLSDNYYIVFLNNTLNLDGNINRKRSNEEVKNVISATIGEIHNLIIKNKDTFKDVEKFEEIENQVQNIASLGKRDEANKDETNYVYEVASVNERTALYAYLSSDLIDTVSSLPNVISCLPRRKFSLTNIFNNKDIKAETKWKDVKTKNNAPIHLSLISQGRFDEELVGKYDKNYYYPKTAGKDIDIFMFDAGFNFTYRDFPKTKDRTVKCEVIVDNGKVHKSLSSDTCYYFDYEDHGSQTAAVASGTVHGVANRANTYGIVVVSEDRTVFWENLMAGLKYVKNNLFRPNKAVFNFSFGQFVKNEELVKDDIKMLQELISEISNKGAVFVASAGNEGSQVKDEVYGRSFIPCVLDDVICVGGIANNMEENQNIRIADFLHPINDNMATAQYTREFISNYGKGVDIYAPFWIHYDSSLLLNVDLYYALTEEGYKLKNPITLNNDYVFVKRIDMINGGTSFSSPIVAGVAATIMGENTDVKYNTKTMLEYLIENGEKNIIEFADQPNVFINNGKHTVYSRNLIYHGCGTYSGNKKCGRNQCCGGNSHCQVSDSDSCKVSEGCQIAFGKCLSE